MHCPGEIPAETCSLKKPGEHTSPKVSGNPCKKPHKRWQAARAHTPEDPCEETGESNNGCGVPFERNQQRGRVKSIERDGPPRKFIPRGKPCKKVSDEINSCSGKIALEKHLGRNPSQY
jgi:hypothetical protein